MMNRAILVMIIIIVPAGMSSAPLPSTGCSSSGGGFETTDFPTRAVLTTLGASVAHDPSY